MTEADRDRVPWFGRRQSARPWVAATVLGCFGLGTCCLTPALMSGVPLRPKLAQRVVSPDGRFEMQVWRRLAWPPNELVDPGVVVRLVVLRRDSDDVLGQACFELVEDSDLVPADVQWEREEVVVSGFDERTARTLHVRLP